MKVLMILAGAATSLGSSMSMETDPAFGLIPRYNQGDVASDLLARLSPGANVFVPGDENFDSSTARWSVYQAPNVTITVEVATENDVAETVKFANECKRPFLAVNNGHGAITTVGKMKNGIQISMRKLKDVTIGADGTTATFGAGVLAKDVTDSLWAAGKQTVTGGCECVSIVGPGLGGGHGFLQGRYGLISDQFVSLNLVTANGSVLKIDKNHELWWAVQGAGHNFGVVTSITSKIYDVVRPKWALQSFIFSGDKVEGLYANINDKLLKNGTQEVELMNYSYFTYDTSIDPVNPVIMFFILQEDAETVDEQFTAPFTALGPLASTSEAGDYRSLPTWTGNSNEQIFCQNLGFSALRFPIELQNYDIAAQREIYDLYNAAIKETPALSASVALFEGYPLQGVKAVSESSTAYPFRASNLLVSPVMLFAGDEPEIVKKGEALGTRMRDILFKASGQPNRRVYVNYAYGNEGPLQWYGAEGWRQDKLKSLKKKYDPEQKFSFYAPIA